jgi:hypothetical protein
MEQHSNGISRVHIGGSRRESQENSGVHGKKKEEQICISASLIVIVISRAVVIWGHWRDRILQYNSLGL